MKSPYIAKTFNIRELKGISQKTIEEHLKLYQGYVTHTNLILETLDAVTLHEGRGSREQNKEKEVEPYALSEMQRRFAFEFDGMKNHECYFSSLENGPKEINKESELYKSIEYVWGSFDIWLDRFKIIAKTRGIGWAMLYIDPSEKILLNTWVDEQHLGQLSGCKIVLALDMWEHSFVADYEPSGKGQYIDDFFENLNWSVIEKNFEEGMK